MKHATNNLIASVLREQILENRFSDVEKMNLLCKELIVISEETNDLYSNAFASLYMFDYALTQGNYDACRFYLFRTQLLCQENHFNDLLLVLNNIAGMYYQDIFEEQSALQHYLQGLDLAREQNEPVMESKLLNNIGICFLRRNDNVSASEYFHDAYLVIEAHAAELSESDFGNAVGNLCNLAEAYRGINRMEDSEKTLLKAEALNVNIKYWELCLCHAWCGHYARSGDAKRSIAYSRKLWEEGIEQTDSVYQKISATIEVCGYMLDVGCQELALRYLKQLENYCDSYNLGDYYNCQVLGVRYYERYGSSEEIKQAYQKFYKASVKMNNKDKSMRVQAQLAKIELTSVIQEREAMHQENRKLEDASYIDELTLIYNRRYISKLISKVALDHQTVNIGCIFIDVDYFKQYNDFYGHFDGDDVLKRVAKILSENAGEGVYPSRYGGDEFLVLCVNWSNERIEGYIKSVQSTLTNQRLEHVKSLYGDCITLSIGYSNGKIKDLGSTDQLLKLADKALYSSKKQGRNCFSKLLFGE